MLTTGQCFSQRVVNAAVKLQRQTLKTWDPYNHSHNTPHLSRFSPAIFCAVGVVLLQTSVVLYDLFHLLQA